LEKIEILIAGKKEEAFSKIVPKDKILSEGRYFCRIDNRGYYFQ
jgi:translation elongation factor EF-4